MLLFLIPSLDLHDDDNNIMVIFDDNTNRPSFEIKSSFSATSNSSSTALTSRVTQNKRKIGNTKVLLSDQITRHRNSSGL